MNKFDRIQYIQRLGFNTENSIQLKSTNDDAMKMFEWFTKSLTQISLRCYNPKDEKASVPHFPIINVHDAPDKIKLITSNGLVAIVATPIDPKYAIYAGTIWKEDVTITIELAKGPCTVRKVTHDGIIDISIILHNLQSDADKIKDTRVAEMIVEAMAFPHKHCILEMSYYSIPIGTKNKNIIIWDVTGDGTPQSAEF